MPGFTARARAENSATASSEPSDGTTISCSPRRCSDRAAGDEDRQPRRGGEELGDESGGGRHLLEVVEHQQHVAIPNRLAQPLDVVSRAHVDDADRTGDGGRDEIRIVHRRQVDEPHAIGETRSVVQLPGDLDGESGLADPAGTEQRHQPHVGVPQQIGDLGELDVSAEERRRRSRDHGHVPLGETDHPADVHRTAPTVGSHRTPTRDSSEYVSPRDANSHSASHRRCRGTRRWLRTSLALQRRLQGHPRRQHRRAVPGERAGRARHRARTRRAAVRPAVARPRLEARRARRCGVGGDLARGVVLRQADRRRLVRLRRPARPEAVAGGGDVAGLRGHRPGHDDRPARARRSPTRIATETES